MATGTLIMHCGGKVATRDEVAACAAPPATKTWNPARHIVVLETVEQLLVDAGYGIAREQLGLSGDGHKFFATIDLESRIAPGVSLALGLRNSTDKTFPYGLAGGTRTFVCDNLALTGDWDELSIRKKHTTHGRDRFIEALAVGIGRLEQYRAMESARTARMMAEGMDDDRARSLLLQAFERRLISHVPLRAALEQWAAPTFDWGPKTAWRLFNACTTPLQGRATSNPGDFAKATQGLMGLICPAGGDEPGLVPGPAGRSEAGRGRDPEDI